jgi:hypothetical protein
MRYQKDGIVYDEPQLREKLLDMGYNDFDFEEKVEELGYKPVGEMTAQTMPVNEEVLNEGFFQWVGMKLASWAIGVVPEKELNKSWDKLVAKMPKEGQEKARELNPSRKEKVNILRAAIRKAYDENKSYKKIVEQAAKDFKEKAKELSKKEKTLSEDHYSDEKAKVSFIMSIGNILASLLAMIIVPNILVPFIFLIISSASAIYNAGKMNKS